MHAKKGHYRDSVDPDETPVKRGVTSASSLFAKINILLVMIGYKNVYYQALIYFHLIGDKSSKGDASDQVY